MGLLSVTASMVMPQSADNPLLVVQYTKGPRPCYHRSRNGDTKMGILYDDGSIWFSLPGDLEPCRTSRRDVREQTELVEEE